MSLGKRNAGSHSCPNCGLPYSPGDYSQDVADWLCSGCRNTLPHNDIAVDESAGVSGAEVACSDEIPQQSEYDAEPDRKCIESLAEYVFGKRPGVLRSMLSMGGFLWPNFLMIIGQIAGVAAIFNASDWNPFIVFMLVVGGAVFAFIQIGAFIMHARAYLRLLSHRVALPVKKHIGVVVGLLWTTPGLVLFGVIAYLIVWAVFSIRGVTAPVLGK